MVARIHYRKAGIEYVLQYNSETDTIELRRNGHTLIGGTPNYFRYEWGTSVYEMRVFTEAVLNHRPVDGLTSFPELSDAEKALIHEFEQIADINLLLTPESINRHQMLEIAAHERLPSILESILEDFSQSPAFNRVSTGEYLTRLGDLQGIPRLENESDSEYRERLDASPHTPQSLRDENPDMNTEGMTEEEIEDNLEFIARLLNGESIPATEFPLRSRNNDASDLDDFLREIDETLEEPINDDDTVRAAPAHRFYMTPSIVASLWRQANDEDDET